MIVLFFKACILILSHLFIGHFDSYQGVQIDFVTAILITAFYGRELQTQGFASSQNMDILSTFATI